MSAPVKTWASLPASAATDAAMRRAAAVEVCGWKAVTLDGRLTNYCDNSYMTTARHPAWLRNWNRDDLARVFAAARNRIAERGDDDDEEIRSAAYDQMWAAWERSLDDPRAALASLLDLLSVPVPQELHQ